MDNLINKFKLFFSESIKDHNIRTLEEKKTKFGSLSWQDEQMLNNMKYGIGRTG